MFRGYVATGAWYRLSAFQEFQLRSGRGNSYLHERALSDNCHIIIVMTLALSAWGEPAGLIPRRRCILFVRVLIEIPELN